MTTTTSALSFRQLLTMIEAPPIAGGFDWPEVEPLQQQAAQASAQRRAALAAHPWAEIIAPSNTQPAWQMESALEAWASVAVPHDVERWRELGDNTLCHGPHDVARLLETLGRLVEVVGREAVDEGIRAYAAERIRVAELRHKASHARTALVQALQQECQRHPEHVVAIYLGHVVGHMVADVMAQADKEYWEVRRMRDDAGVLSPAAYTRGDISAIVAGALAGSEIGTQHVIEILTDTRFARHLPPTSSGLLADAGAAWTAAGGPAESWWLAGCRRAAEYFGDTTLADLAQETESVH